MSETTSACVRGCSMYRKHLVECEGATDETCRGCLPKRAKVGQLCDTCHRRLELMLTDAPTVIRWLTGHLATATSNAAKHDHDRIRGASDDLPAALRVGILDHRDLLRDRLTLWVDDWCEFKGLTGPQRHTPEVDAKYLLTWLPGICGLDWIGDWWNEMAETMAQAHGMAPWRPAMRRMPGVPCPGCAETQLVIFGGESDVNCAACRITMTSDKFGLWERVLKAEREVAS